MRLNNFITPDEMTLVPLNENEVAQPHAETTQAENRTQHARKRYCFYCNKFGHFKAECRKVKRHKWQQFRINNGQTNCGTGNTLYCDTCGKLHKTENCLNGANAANDPRPRRRNEKQTNFSNLRQPKLSKNQKTKYVAPALRGNSRREGVFNRRSPTEDNNNSKTNCSVTTTDDWLRRQAIATKKDSAKNEQQKGHPEWIEESDDENMTTKKPLTESIQERVYVCDKDYSCDLWDKPDL